MYVTLGFCPHLYFQGPTMAHGTLQEPRSSTLPQIYHFASSFQGHIVSDRKEKFPRPLPVYARSIPLPEPLYIRLIRRLRDVLSWTNFWNMYQIPFHLQIYKGCMATPETSQCGEGSRTHNGTLPCRPSNRRTKGMRNPQG